MNKTMLLQIVIWILAIYGLIEISINIFNGIAMVNNNIKDMYILIAVKNQEDTIEGIVRSIVFKNIYYKNEDMFNNILIADMGSTDDTINILRKLSKEYSFLKIVDCKESQEFLYNILGKQK